MAMQSGIVYGRLIVGQAKQIVRSFVVKGLTPTQSFRLVTAYCGFAKLNSNQPKKKFLYGEDSFFIAENKFANVLGMYLVVLDIKRPNLMLSMHFTVTILQDLSVDERYKHFTYAAVLGTCCAFVEWCALDSAEIYRLLVLVVLLRSRSCHSSDNVLQLPSLQPSSVVYVKYTFDLSSAAWIP